MQQKDDGGRTYILSTGREVEASFGGYIGLSADLDIGVGADGSVDLEFPDSWTYEECAELADFMIEQWTRFKASRRP